MPSSIRSPSLIEEFPNGKPSVAVGSRWRLFVAVLSADLLYLSAGCVLTWASPIMTKLMDAGIITEAQGYWLGSVSPLGAIFGPIINTLAIDSIGRKGALLVNAVVFIISWIILSSTIDLNWLYIGRFIGGFAMGNVFISVPVYVTEVTDVRFRQSMSSISEFFLGLGYVVQYGIGPFVSFTWLNIISGLIAVLFGIIFIFMPESPYYLLLKNRREDALNVLRWFRGNIPAEEVIPELNKIQEELDDSQLHAGKMTDLFMKPGPRKSFFIAMYVLFIQLVSGIDVITSFTEHIFRMAKIEERVDPATGAMYVGFMTLIATLPVPFIVKRIGLKKLLINTSIPCGLFCVAFAVYQFMLEHKQDVSYINWLPVLSLVGYNIFFCIGLGPLPWIVAAEIFPPSLKGIAITLCTSIGWFLCFIFVTSFGLLSPIIGSSWLFAFFGLSTIIGMLGVHVWLPDTQTMTLLDIQKSMRNKKINI